MQSITFGMKGNSTATWW